MHILLKWLSMQEYKLLKITYLLKEWGVNILKNVKRYFGVSGTIFLIGAGIGFFAIYFDIKGLAYISIACCGISLLINKDGNINW